MKFSYDEYTVITKEINIDFKKVENFVRKNVAYTDLFYIHDDFIDNLEYYLEEIYDLYNVEDELFLDDVEKAWTNYMKEKYEI